jgi:trigger factor
MTAQIVEKTKEGLSRLYGVTIPVNDLAKKLDAKVAELAPKMQLKGFRPGKVPPAHVKRMYGKDLMGEVVQETLTATNEKVLNDNNIRAAGTPELKPVSDMDEVLAGKSDFNYDLAVEVMPDIQLADIEKLKLKKPVYAPTDKDVDETLAGLAKQNASFESRTGKAVKAKAGDQVVIDFVGKIDGEAFEGGTASDAPLVLGSGQFIPGFEDQLVGTKSGDEVEVKVTFPETYQAENLRGKDAVFEVTVKDVKKPVERKVDEDLAKALGIESLDKLKEMIRANLAQQYEENSKFKLKRAMLDELDKTHSFDLPPRMVDAEFEVIWKQVLEDEQREGRSDEDKDKSEDELKAEYRKIAERRVRLGLVLAEIGRVNNVQVTDQEVGQAMQRDAVSMARQYNMEPQQVYDILRQNPNYATQARAPLFEQKVVDFISGKAQVTDKKVSKEELLKEDDLPEGYGGA